MWSLSFLPNFDIVNYADDYTPYAANNDIVDILSNLKLQSNILNKWFKGNYMKASPGKYHLLLSATEESVLILFLETFMKNIP